MGKLYDGGHTRGVDGTDNWARLMQKPGRLLNPTSGLRTELGQYRYLPNSKFPDDEPTRFGSSAAPVFSILAIRLAPHSDASNIKAGCEKRIRLPSDQIPGCLRPLPKPTTVVADCWNATPE